MSPERLIHLPIDAARLAGRIVLWATEKAKPMEPLPPGGRPASIQYYQTPERKK